MNEKSEMGLAGLQVWQRAMTLAGRIYKDVLPVLPPEEKWAMSNQLRRAAQSFPANLAEGHGRYYYQDNVRFCYIARGSLQEAFTYLSLACQIGYIPEMLFISLEHEYNDLRRMINSYITYLKTSKLGGSEPGANLVLKETRADYSFESENCLDPSNPDDDSMITDQI